MANSGKNTNNSQFFITFDACNHLDNKHTIFGRAVGGMEVLDKLEKVRVGRGKNANKPEHEIKINEVTVFVNPFNEPWQREDPWKKKDVLPVYDPREDDLGSWFSAPQPVLQAVGTGVGKYLPVPTSKKRKATESTITHPSLASSSSLTSSSLSSSSSSASSSSSLSSTPKNSLLDEPDPSLMFSLTSYRQAKVVKRRQEAAEKEAIKAESSSFGDFAGW